MDKESTQEISQYIKGKLLFDELIEVWDKQPDAKYNSFDEFFEWFNTFCKPMNEIKKYMGKNDEEKK